MLFAMLENRTTLCREESFIHKQPLMIDILIVELSYEWASKLDKVSHGMIMRPSGGSIVEKLNIFFVTRKQKTNRQFLAFKDK